MNVYHIDVIICLRNEQLFSFPQNNRLRCDPMFDMF